MKIKICGITSIRDADLAIQAGADAVGINMVAGPRQVSAEVAAEIASFVRSAAVGLSRSVCPVVLGRVTSDQLDAKVEQVVRGNRVKWLQLYGAVTPWAIRFQRQAGREPAPIVRVQSEGFALEFNTFLGECGDNAPSAVLLDAYHRDKLGGTGEPLCWPWVVAARDRGELDGWPPIVLAGGLTPENVGDAVRAVRPWAVDVSSGVEASPGRKDPIKLQEFIARGRAALG